MCPFHRMTALAWLIMTALWAGECADVWQVPLIGREYLLLFLIPVKIIFLRHTSVAFCPTLLLAEGNLKNYYNSEATKRKTSLKKACIWDAYSWEFDWKQCRQSQECLNLWIPWKYILCMLFSFVKWGLREFLTLS